ncbi:MAG: CotH kinase family protein, partial [Pirellulales bacterium]|nr:CotH kinase family protein [Pirellulales bacterium]
GFGFPPDGFGFPPDGFGFPPDGFLPPPQGFGPPSEFGSSGDNSRSDTTHGRPDVPMEQEESGGSDDQKRENPSEQGRADSHRGQEESGSLVRPHGAPRYFGEDGPTTRPREFGSAEFKASSPDPVRQGPRGMGGFGRGQGRGRGGPGFGEGGPKLDPLVATDDPRKPLRMKLLAVPSLRAKYLQYVRTIAETSLHWDTLGPFVAQCRALIEKEVEADTRKLSTFEAFQAAASDSPNERTIGRGMSLRQFIEQRRAFLLQRTAK